MFEPEKQVVVTKTLDSEIDRYFIFFMLQQISKIPVKKDYLQIFRFSVIKNYLQFVEHEQEQPAYKVGYYLPDIPAISLYTGKVYAIDDGDHICIMLADDY